MAKPELDDVTGVETTGHEWDGIKELNHPLPSWWVWLFWICTIWAIAYSVAYPAWPMLSDYTKGYLGYSQRQAAMDDVKAGRDAQAGNNNALATISLADLKANADLFNFASQGGKAIFNDNCAPCHQSGAKGAKGYPNLNDDDWLWGGKIEDINTTIKHGIRSGDKNERNNAMPKFGIDGTLNAAQISDAAEYVLSLSGNKGEAAAVGRGKAIFAEQQCATCHGEDGKGNQDMGAPNLTDGIWLYGGEKADIEETIRTGRGGVMPAWAPRFANDPTAITKLTAYIYSLGGGK
jgi:cytochrome c oxidase cbb3-type subunit III